MSHWSQVFSFMGSMFVVGLVWVVVQHWLGKKWAFFNVPCSMQELKHVSLWLFELPIMSLLLMLFADESFATAYVSMALCVFAMDFWDTVLFHHENW